MSWDTAVKEAKESTSGGLFLRFEDGDAAKVVFLGEPFTYQSVWVDGRTEIFDKDKHKGVRPSFKARINVYNTETREVQIFDMSATTLGTIDKEVNGARDKDGKVDPEMPGGGLNAIYKIRREGTKKNTTYHVAHIKALTEDQQEKIASLTLHELDPNKVEKKDTQDGPAEFDGEDVPF